MLYLPFVWVDQGTPIIMVYVDVVQSKVVFYKVGLCSQDKWLITTWYNMVYIVYIVRFNIYSIQVMVLLIVTVSGFYSFGGFSLKPYSVETFINQNSGK